NAASAVAAVRGDVAFVALAGHAVAFAWRAGELTGQRGVLRFPRPLGLEQDPLITLWSTPLEIGDRLVLVCGASWRPDSAEAIKDILVSAPSPESAEEQLAEALGQSRPAGVLVISPRTESRDVRQLRLLPSTEPRPPAPPLPGKLVQPAPAAVPGRLRRATRTWLPALAGILLLTSLVAAALTTSSGARQQPLVAPEPAAASLTRVDTVDPAMAVRLGPSAANVIDLAVGDDAVYTLDTVEASVRAFTLDGLDQQPTPETLIARPGAPISGTSRQLTTPVAIEYVQGASPDEGALTLIDQARSVVQIGRDHRLNPRVVPSSAGWLDIGALGAGPTGDLFVLDARSRAVLAYRPLGQRPADPPRVALDATTAPNLLFEHAAEIVGEANSVVVRMDNGSVHRFDTQGVEQPLLAAGTRLARITAIASDRLGGLYLVDAASARVLQLSADGNLLRELRDPGLAGLRAIQASLDGQRLYGLVASGIMVFDIPPL
ncbi:MAG TPA: hypothetical protein VF937_03310, partial [Chloroflexota bacterium]